MGGTIGFLLALVVLAAAAIILKKRYFDGVSSTKNASVVYDNAQGTINAAMDKPSNGVSGVESA